MRTIYVIFRLCNAHWGDWALSPSPKIQDLGVGDKTAVYLAGTVTPPPVKKVWEPLGAVGSKQNPCVKAGDKVPNETAPTDPSFLIYVLQ